MAYTAFLQCLPNNSAYIYRIQRTQAEMLARQNKKKTMDLTVMERGLKDGYYIQSDDTQENLFVDAIHTLRKGSKKVFSGLYLNEQELLTQILTTAFLRLDANEDIFKTTFFFLDLSDLLVERFGYSMYEKGCPDEEHSYLSHFHEYEANKDKLKLSSDELNACLDKHGLSFENIKPYIYKKGYAELEKVLKCYGYSRTLELHPFYPCRVGGYLILSPSYLLHCAYMAAYDAVIHTYGESFFRELLLNIQQEVIVLLQQHSAACYKHNVKGDVAYVLMQFDTDKALCITIADATNQSIEKTQTFLANEIHLEHPDAQILHLFVPIQMDDEMFCGITLLPGSVTLKLEDLRVFCSNREFSIMNLYYYSKDRDIVGYMPLSADKDKLAYYLDHKCTFYMDDQPAMMWILPDSYQSMKYETTKHQSVHDVMLPLNKGAVRITHCKDIPDGVPIYDVYLSEDTGLKILELSSTRLFVFDMNDNNDYAILHKELTICLMNWLYAIEQKYGVRLFERDLCFIFHISESGMYCLFKLGTERCYFSYTLSWLDDENWLNIEPKLIKETCRQLIKLGFMNNVVTDSMIDAMFEEIGKGRFLQMGNNDPRTIRDEHTTNYSLSNRWADVILSDIADHINRKGVETPLSMEESAKILTDTVMYLQDEAVSLIKQFDTEYLVQRLIELHHSMIYWSAISTARYQGLSRAYEYIGANYAYQDEYANSYSEMKIISQGIVEYIFMNSIMEHHPKKGTAEMIDRLFALMHHIIEFGSCIDNARQGIKGSEITLLKNGRIVFPRPAIAISNKYFCKLRSDMMNHPDRLNKLYNELPDYILDTTDARFLNAFRSEYGFTYEQSNKIAESSFDYLASTCMSIARMTETDFKKHIVSDILSKEEYASFKAEWMLTSAQTISNLDSRDFFLQRFNRDTQFSTRPWILFNGIVFISAKILIESMKIFNDRLSFGILRADTKNKEGLAFMMSKVTDEKGKYFNKLLYDYYDKLNIPSVQLFSEEPIKPGSRLPANKDLGDIDLLLINTDTKQIVCVEAKNYYEARDVYSMLDQNKNMEKHLKKAERRDKWCQEHKEAFKSLSTDVDDSYNVETVFLTYYEPVYRYFDHTEPTPLRIISGMELVENPMCLFNM